MAAARAFYEGLLGLELRQVVYDWFVGYWVSAKHEMTLCISTSPDERRQWGPMAWGWWLILWFRMWIKFINSSGKMGLRLLSRRRISPGGCAQQVF